MDKLNAEDILKSIAEAIGYDLVKKKREQALNNIRYAEYDALDSVNLNKCLQKLLSMEAELTAKSNLVAKQVTEYMKNKKPNNATSRAYDGNRFMHERLIVDDETLKDVRNRIDYVKSLLTKAQESELLADFVANNKELDGCILSMKPELTPSGVYKFFVKTKLNVKPAKEHCDE